MVRSIDLEALAVARADEQLAAVTFRRGEHERDTWAIREVRRRPLQRRRRTICRLAECGRVVWRAGLCAMHGKRAQAGTEVDR